MQLVAVDVPCASSDQFKFCFQSTVSLDVLEDRVADATGADLDAVKHAASIRELQRVMHHKDLFEGFGSEKLAYESMWQNYRRIV